LAGGVAGHILSSKRGKDIKAEKQEQRQKKGTSPDLSVLNGSGEMPHGLSLTVSLIRLVPN